VGVNTASNQVSVLLGNGDGTFRTAQSFFPSGDAQNPAFIVTGDFNGDGKPDLATTNYQFLSIYLGKGDGTFGLPTNYHLGFGLGAPLVADLNKDNKLDLVVSIPSCSSSCPPSGFAVLFGKGDGTFQRPVYYNLGPLTGASGVPYLSSGDVNADGALDIVGLAYTPGFALLTDELTSVMSIAGTRIHLSSSPNPSKSGQPVTFTATVTPGLPGYAGPTGKVKFQLGAKVLTAPLKQGRARVVYAFPAKGTYKVQANYLGDVNYLNHTSTVLLQQVR
jgi:hypothetical protein